MPTTKEGARFVELAEEHAAAAAAEAAENDRAGTFPHALFAAMQESGFLAATVPADLGGLGVTTVSDLTAGISRLARGDGSAAFACGNALGIPLVMSVLGDLAERDGDEATAAGLRGVLAAVGAGMVFTTTGTEPGTDLAHPLVEATPADGGWVINGRKTFGTLSPISSLFLVTCRLRRPDGSDGMASAIVLRGAPGLLLHDNWDALGMRATGSGDVEYKDCFVANEAMIDNGDAWGTFSPQLLLITFTANVAILGVYVGIAEAARDLVVRMARTKTKVPSNRPIAEHSGVQHLVAEMDISIATSRAVLERTCRLFDDAIAHGSSDGLTLEAVHSLGHAYQCAKLHVNRAAVEVVDRAMTICGGASYMSAHPLSRLYRDVRAGSFMQPYSPVEGFEYIGRVALGLDPSMS